MDRAVIIILLTTRVIAERRSVQQSVYVSRKSRSNSMPIETGFVYNQVNYHPGTLDTFGNDAGHYNSPSHGHYYSDYYPLKSPSYPSSPVPSYEYLKAKAETKYESNFLPSKMKSDAMYEKLKALMHYKYPEDTAVHETYDPLNDYHADEDDVRTSSRTSYDGWPYFYHSPYEYEAMKADTDAEKAKDKRFVVEPVRQVIPVHEETVDDIPHYYNHHVTTAKYKHEVTSDNPIYGDQPFFSFVLNDYFDKSGDDDSLVFKGLDWGREFDKDSNFPEVDDYLKRNRRVGNHDGGTTSSHSYDSSKLAAADSTTEKGYRKENSFDKHEKGNKEKEEHKSVYENAGNKHNGFKNFVDTFANRFGGEEHKKDANYAIKKNQDKGEKKKGFRRVYHKDEYQQEDEFYENSNSSAKGEEKGGSSAHHGGSEAILKSHATAAIGNDASAYNNAGNKYKNKFENNHHGNELNKGYDNEFNRYRDVAKLAAQSNSADYVDSRYKP